MTFGEALEALKAGQYVAREGWKFITGSHVCLYTRPGFDPYFVMWSRQKSWQPDWMPSPADMLADDWTIVHPTEGTIPATAFG